MRFCVNSQSNVHLAQVDYKPYSLQNEKPLEQYTFNNQDKSLFLLITYQCDYCFTTT